MTIYKFSTLFCLAILIASCYSSKPTTSVAVENLQQVLLNSKKGDTIRLEAKHYQLTKPLIISQEITIIGNKYTTLSIDKANRPAIIISGTKNVSIIGLKIMNEIELGLSSVKNADLNTDRAQSIGILIRKSSNIVISKNTIQRFRNAGIFSSYSKNIQISNNMISGTYPDVSLEFGDTHHQQFGIIVYAANYSDEIINNERVYQGIAEPHDLDNIAIKGNTIKDNTIAISIFPGYKDVVISKNITTGTITQHSIYAFPNKNLTISDNKLIARQNVGIKLSLVPKIMKTAPTGLLISRNTISNTTAPSISLEVIDKDKNGKHDIFTSRIWFEDVTITNNQFIDIHDIAISAACSSPVAIKSNVFRNQTLVLSESTRPLINLRNADANISENSATNAEREFVNGLIAERNSTIISNNILVDVATKRKGVAISLAPYRWKFPSQNGAVNQNKPTTSILKVENNDFRLQKQTLPNTKAVTLRHF